MTLLYWITLGFISLLSSYSLQVNHKLAYGRQVRSKFTFKRMETSTESNINEYKPITEEISDIIDYYYDKSKEMPIRVISPVMIIENSHILTKSRYYEEVMSNKISNSIDSKDTKILEEINEFLLGYINSERRSRLRLKVNYILSSIVENKLEDAIDLLSETDEIDGNLLSYLESLVEKEKIRASGAMTIDDDDVDVNSVGKDTLITLRMIQKRLRVEYEMKGRNEVKLLGKLLRENDSEKRDNMMLQSLEKIEDLDVFMEFIAQGIDHILKMSVKQDLKENEMESMIDTYDPTYSSSSSSNRNVIENLEKITSETYSKMKDIYASLQQWKIYLQTGMVSDDVYSTSADDYISKSLNINSNSKSNKSSDMENNSIPPIF